MLTTASVGLDKFTTFGDLLRYLRRREGLTQRELSIVVGYSEAQISRLEQNQRLPDPATITARFVPALHLGHEPEVVARLLELAAAVRREDAPASGLPPFKGLLYFDEADTDLFFGREALTARLVSRLTASLATPSAPRFLAVIGASGSGKSSVVRAGVIPALRWNPDTADWPVNVLTPTAHPLEALAASVMGGTKSSTARAALEYEFAREPRGLHEYLRRAIGLRNAAAASRVLLAVDQFEELFTLCRNKTEQVAFVDNLLYAAFDPEGQTIVVLALRADFYAHCADFPDLREALAQHQEYIGMMSADELRRAIEEPARRGSWELEPGLVELLLKDVGADGSRPPEPGALPLLSHALLETWLRRRGRTLTLSGYTASGGVRGAIAETAEAVFHDQLNPSQRAIARHIFLRLTELGKDETLTDTRRRAALDELVVRPDEALAVREVLTLLADARLITTEQDTVEVAHEALIREWPTLRQWLTENREGLRLHRQLTEAAQEWERSGRDESVLYRGARLVQALEWAAADPDEPNALELTFLAASSALAEREVAEREAQHQRELEAARQLAETEKARADSERQRAEQQVRYVTRVRTRNRAIATAGGIALVLAVLAGLFGLQSNRNATLAQQNLSAAQVANTQSAENAATAQAASTLAFENADTANAEKQNAQESQAEAEHAAKVAFARELASAAIANLDVDPELSILLAIEAVSQTYAMDQTALPEAEDALHRAVGASRVQHTLPSHPTSWTRLAFSPDGTRLTTDVLGGKTIWDTATGKALFTLPLKDGASFDVVFSPDGTRVTTVEADRAMENVVTVKAWDLLSGQQVLTTPLSVNFDDFVWEVSHSTTTGSGNVLPDNTDELIWDTFSPDGRLYATALNDGRVRIWDTATGALLRTIAAQSIYLNRLAFNQEGTKLAANAELNTVWIWDVGTGQLLATLFGRAKAINVAFSPDGPRFAIANGDFTATLWNAASGQELQTLFGHANDVTVVKFSPDGRRVATASWDRKVIMWDSATGQQLFTLSGHTGVIWDLVFSPDGTRLATYSTDGTVKLWDVSPGGELPTLSIQAFFSSAFNSDQTRIAVAQLDFTVGIWDMATGKALLTLTDPLGINTVAFSPDGTRLVTTSPPNLALMVWDAATGKQLLKLTDLDVLDATFSRDGTRIVTAHADGSVNVWEAATGKLPLHLGTKHEAAVWTVAYSRDGSRIVSAAEDGTVKVWDAETGQELLSLLHTSNIGIKIPWGLDFSPDGKRFVTGSQAGTAKVWDLETGQELFTLSGHTGTIYRVAYSPDGTQIATAAYDSNSTAKVWDATTGKLLLTLYGATKGLNGITFSLDGKRLITVSDDGNMRTYLLRLEDELALARSRLTRTWRLEECQQYLHVAQCP